MFTLKRQLATALLFTIVAFFTTACSDSNNNMGPPDTDGTGGTKPGQALLGPIVDATVSVYDSRDYEDLSILDDDPDNPACEVKTTKSENLDEAGLILLPAECIEKDLIYIVKVTGGMDIDVDDDGILDDTPTPHESSIHAIILGERIYAKPWKVTRVTDLMYFVLRALFQGGTTAEEFLTQMDNMAQLVLKDVNGDDIIDHNDVLEWNPRDHEQLFNPEVLQDIEELQTLSPQQVNEQLSGFTGHVDTFMQANDVKVQGNYAYVLTNTQLHVIDISDPSKPHIINTASTPEDLAIDFHIHDHWLYLRTYKAITAYDITEPGEIVKVSSSPLMCMSSSIDADGNLWVGLATLEGGYRIFSIADAEHGIFDELTELTESDILTIVMSERFRNDIKVKPVNQSSFDLFRFFGNVAVLGFMGGTEATILIVDFSDSDNPQLISEIITPGFLRWPLDALIKNNELLLSIGHGDFTDLSFVPTLMRFDISDFSMPVQLTLPQQPSLRTLDQIGNALYAWESSDRLTRRNADTLELEASIPLPTVVDASLKTLTDITAFLLSRNDPDTLSDPFDQEGMKSYNKLYGTYRYPEHIAIEGDYVYFAAAEYGLLIYRLP